MRSITRTALVLACSAALAGSMAVPASAADTTTTVEITGQGISLTAPTGAALSTGTPGQDSTVTLDPTTVTDARASTINWVATVSLPALTGELLTSETIPTDEATYLASAATAISGSPTFEAPVSRLDLSTAAQVSQTTSAVSGNNSASWTAVLTVPIPAQVLADTYEGVLTQSVS